MRCAWLAVPLAAVLALSACGGQPPARPGVSPTSPATTSPPSLTEPTATAVDTGPGVAVTTVQAWLDALRDGDLDTARSMLGQSSAMAVESMGGLEQLASALAEGMAAFGADGVEWDAVRLQGVDAYLVTATGEIEREGMSETDAHAWLVHPEDGRDVVEAFATPLAEVVQPGPASTLPAGAAVDVLLPAGAVHAVADGEPVEAAVDGADGGRVRVAVRPDGGWSPGRHVVAVASVPESAGAAGPWASVAVTFETG